MARRRRRTFLRVRHNPWLMGLAATPFLASVGLLVAGAVGTSYVGLLSFYAALAGAIASLFVYHKNPMRRLHRIDVAVKRDTVVFGDERVARGEIAEGVMTPGGTVRLGRGLVKAAIVLEGDAASGRELLDELGLGATKQVATFRGGSLLYQKTWRVMALIPLALAWIGGAKALASALQTPAFASVGLIPFVIAIFTVWFWPSRIQVGADGVLVRWMGYQRFIPHDHIVHVAIDERGFGNARRKVVELTLEGGKTFVLPMGQAAYGGQIHAEVAERIEEALEAHRRGAEAHDAALLERRGRSHEDWVAALGALCQQLSHRKAPVATAALWRVVEDASTPPVERVAAAVALRGAMSRDERERLAITARATAAPRLRIALDAAAAPDTSDEALAEALAELEAEELERWVDAR